MFHSARLKLTAWYLLIIMLISIFFSVAFYHLATIEIERVIRRIEFRQEFPDRPMPSRNIFFYVPTQPSLEELENSKHEILILLFIINSCIFLLAGYAGYFLAGRTLNPIKRMIDEQNQFITSASHELRTPIATLRAEMEGSLLEKHISDNRARTLIQSNLEELGTLQGLSDNLLQIAHVHKPNHGTHVQNVSLSEIISSAQKKVLPLAKKKTITFKTEVKETIITGDKNRLIELFVILFDNAIKYSLQKTSVDIHSEEEDRKVNIYIRDQGFGISKTDLPHIFERFYRAHKSQSSTDGYGLGLSIAKKIVEAHNGTITVESKEKKGATFIIQFPLPR